MKAFKEANRRKSVLKGDLPEIKQRAVKSPKKNTPTDIKREDSDKILKLDP